MGNKIRRVSSYLAAALFLCGGCWFFYELFLSAGRDSFFSFQSDFLAGFMPWNAPHNMYPGEKHGFFDLLAAFMAQFYRGPGVAAVTVGGGLAFCALLTLACRKLFRFTRRKAVLFFLPLFWAAVFLAFQVNLALRQETDWLGFRYHKLDRLLRKTERLVTEKRYEEALQVADTYWFSHPCPIDDVVKGQNTLYAGMPEAEIMFRSDLAAYTRVALSGARRLNDDFFTYYRVPEIYNRMDDFGARVSYKCNVLRGQLTGNHVLSYSQAMNVMETGGLSYDMLDKSVFSALVCFQYDLADKYIRLLKGTFPCRKKAVTYEAASRLLRNKADVSSSVSPDTEAASLAAEIEKERVKAPKKYLHHASGENEARELWRQSPASLENLERVALADLLYKNADSLLARIPAYLELDGQRPPYKLPRAWQELIYALLQENPEKLDGIMPYMKNMAWNNELLKQCGLFYQARERLRQGSMNPRQITQSFGHTFLYNYYFSRLVNMTEAEAAKPLAH